MSKTLKQLCDDITAGYATDITMYDYPLSERIEELSNRTEDIKELIEREQQLGDLLARIHRDGGHYVQEHGWEKACADAENKVVNWLAVSG